MRVVSPMRPYRSVLVSSMGQSGPEQFAFHPLPNTAISADAPLPLLKACPPVVCSVLTHQPVSFIGSRDTKSGAQRKDLSRDSMIRR